MSTANPFLAQPQSRGPSCLVIALAVFGGGAILAALVCCGGIAYLAKPPAASAAAQQPFSLDDVPLPVFPQRGPMLQTDPQITVQEISLGESGGYYSVPGLGGKLVLYLPPGQHQPASLPCVLITGAGSNLLSGMLLGEGDNPEHLPYVKVGYAVVAYELDGPSDDNNTPDSMRKSFEAFKGARAGLINARNALQFVLDRVPEVNPAQIYAAGHSSAATHALLFAEHEPRLAGVIAYAPAVNIPQRFGVALRGLELALPGVIDFATQSSPHTHRQRLKCPTFLFHSEDDTNCPIGPTQDLAEQLKQQGTDVTLVTVTSGGHYQSMIDEGIPAGIKWLRQQERKKLGREEAAP